MKNFVSILLACIMLISAAVPAFASDAGIKMHLNGNEITSAEREIEVNNGIFSATTSGAGLFALAFYKDSELVSVQFAQDDDLSSARLNMVVDSDSCGYDYIKIFRFDEDGKPVDTYNKILKPNKKEEDLRIYFNETFDDDESLYFSSKKSGIIANGKYEMIATSDVQPRIEPSAPNHGRHLIFQADFQIGEKTKDELAYGATESDKVIYSLRLLGLYYTKSDGTRGMSTLVRVNGDKFQIVGTSNNPLSVDEYLSKDVSKRIYVKMDFEVGKYWIYCGDTLLTPDGMTLFPVDAADGAFNQSGFYIGQISGDGPKANKDEAGNIKGYTYRVGDIYIDNISLYEGEKFIDNITDKIPNVHNTDIQPESINHSIYKRPTAAEIAKRTIEAGHPRVIINADKVEKIKTSNDEKIKAWRELVVEKANEALNKPHMTLPQYNPDDNSLDDIPVALETVMNLGLAYQISSDADIKQRYANKAYDWAKVLMEFESVHEGVIVGYKSDGKTPIYKRIMYDWNSDSYLDVGEISTIISICYDWMYDAWTKEQKKEFVESIMRSSIDISYKAYFNQAIKNGGNTKTTWWRSTNNWNAVCNGGVLVAALAFMEEDIYRCSRLAEGTIRGFEYLLPKFAPDGAWAEGTGYWAYTLKYLTIACSTLENCCQTLYGIQNTPGLMRSQTYSLDLEGTTGTFGFGDVGGGEHTKASFMYYWAGVYDDPDIGAAADYAMDKFGFTPNIFDLIYYDPDYVTGNYSRPLSTYRKGTETVTIASGYEDEDTVIAISGGKGDATSHDHLDSGSIIVDMNGVRIIGDTGAEHYDAIGYFDTNRFWYYKARPEGHNIFVINPDKIYESDGKTYYHGQSEQAVSEIDEEEYNKDKNKATMDLTDAYSRDASNAKRTISLEDKTVVVEDDITLRSDGNLVEWYYHFKDIISYVYDGKTYYKSNEFTFDDGRPYCEVEIDNENNCVYITYQEYDVLGKDELVEKGQPKKFRISFKSEDNVSFEIEIRDAQRNTYDESIVKNLRAKGTMSYDYYTYYRGPEYKDDNGKELTDKYEDNGKEFIMDKIVVKMDGVSGTVKLKTIIEAIE